MMSRLTIVFAALAATGALAFLAHILQDTAAKVRSAAPRCLETAASPDKPEANDGVKVRRLPEKPGRPKWLTPFSKELSVGREPIARVSTDWTNVRSTYHKKGWAPDSAKGPVEDPESDSAAWSAWWGEWTVK